MQIILRPYQPGDVEDLVKHANNVNISKYLTNKFPFPYEKKDGEAFIRLALSHDPLQIKAIVLNGEVIGSIGCINWPIFIVKVQKWVIGLPKIFGGKELFR